jgi:hypothetical protein
MYVFLELGIEPRALHMLSMDSTTELCSQLLYYLADNLLLLSVISPSLQVFGC